MGLQLLFEMQEPLDLEILKTKNLEGQNLHNEKFVAIHTELGEAMNEHRGFKFWSNNRKPNDGIYSTATGREEADYFRCFYCGREAGGEGAKVYKGERYVDCPECDTEMHAMTFKNPLLEELVDVLHFLLSIGNDIGASKENLVNFVIAETTVERQHLEFVYALVQLEQTMRMRFADPLPDYKMAFAAYVNLTGLMGFTWQQLSDAYKLKNAENYRRQENGY